MTEENRVSMPDKPFPTNKKIIREIKHRKKVDPKTRRRAVAILLLATIFLSLFFYLRVEIPVWWQKISAPLIISGSSVPSIEPDFSPIKNQIAQLTDSLRGRYGFYVYNLERKTGYGRYEDEAFPAASLVKMPVILALYRLAEEGKMDLTAEYRLEQIDIRSGAGALQSKPIGSVYTFRQLAEAMGKHSDNTAFAALRRIIGNEEIDKTISSLGLKITSLEKFQTGPKDMGQLFARFYEGNFLTPSHNQEIFSFLTKTDFEDWIPAGVPAETTVVHKIGRDLGTFNDAGIVFANKPYVLVIMAKDAREDEAVSVLPKISKAVWEFQNKI